jgi:RimJ/RimL family protein N-acetyltransferase
MTIELRAVGADDWQQWRAMRLAALADTPGAFCSRLSDWADEPEERWRDRLSIPGALNLFAIDTGTYTGTDPGTDTPIGMVTGLPAGDAGSPAELISMWVHPVARGRGVATALITAIAQWAADSGSQTLTLSVLADNEAARRTYERNGFAVPHQRGAQLLIEEREVIMVRDLMAERNVEVSPH